MKKYIIGLALLLAVGGCSNPDRNDDSPWPHVNGMTDSITAALDSIFFHKEDETDFSVLLATLKSISAGEPENKELQGRYLYFEAMRTYMLGDVKEAERKCHDLLSTLDSASHSYLYNRTLHLADNDNRRSLALYDRICRRLDYFEKSGDPFMTASQYTELGNLLKNVRHEEEAVAAYRKADSLYRLAGYEDVAFYNSINMSSALVLAGDTADGIRILQRLRADSSVILRPAIMKIVLHNLYTNTSDSGLLSLLDSIEGDRPEPMTLVFLSQAELSKGNPGKAADLAVSAFHKAAEEGDGDALAWSAYAASSAYESLDEIDSAFYWLKQASEITDQVALLTEADEIVDSDISRAISMRKIRSELEWNRRMLRLVIILGSLLIILLAAAWATASRIRHLKRLREISDNERQSMSRKLMATQIAMDESERLIDSVGKEIDSMTDSGQIAGNAYRPIVNAIRTHAVQREDRETFIESFSTVHPEFSRRMHERSEALTELDIRLASYIVMGMDTKHIASTMGIRPESVKQARWRIRTKLGLAKGERLEDALRTFLD